MNTIGDVLGAPAAAQAGTIATVLDGPPPVLALLNDIAARTIQDQFVTEYADAATAVATNVPWTQLAAYMSCTDLSVARTISSSTLGRLMYRRRYLVTNSLPGRRQCPGPNSLLHRQDPTPFQTGSRLVVQAMLMSPNFLYQLETQQAPKAAPPTPTRLLPAFHARMESRSRRTATRCRGRNNGVTRENQRADDRMLADPRARRGRRIKADDWLGVYSVPARTQLPAFNLTGLVLAGYAYGTAVLRSASFDDKVKLMQLFVDKKTDISPGSQSSRSHAYGYNAHLGLELSANPNRRLLTQGATLGVRAQRRLSRSADTGC